jgi:TonB-dependent SusC/RagA subfamily outer membrane receptor
MRNSRSVKMALAMGVMLVSGGCAADALAQQQPAPPSTMPPRDVPQPKLARIPEVEPNTRLARGGRIRICNYGGYQGPGKPLMIVDGEELSHGSGHEIEPDQIESIEILRGAAAITLYGHRAADGAILVRTKRP